MSSTHLQFGALDDTFEHAICVCIGAGRFLRSVLVPAVRQMGAGASIIASPRSRTFSEYMAGRPSHTYEVDCVSPDGSVNTTEERIAACGTLGDTAGRAAFMALPAKLPKLRLIGLGVTEAGIAHNGRSMLDLAEFLYQCMKADSVHKWQYKLAVINTDNVPSNGDKILK